MTAKAVTTSEVKDWFENIPGLNTGSSLTDTRIDETIQRSTAMVLEERGHSSLPNSGTLERDIVDELVLDRVLLVMAKRHMPDDPELLDAIRREREAQRADMETEKDLRAEVT